ncbi:MAG TPA: DUF4167 domain-containing protein, partial [Sulfitobacter sp.]|nr:DUF4167 domain-containing protein [Sulfitobacter sp.]
RAPRRKPKPKAAEAQPQEGGDSKSDPAKVAE